MNNTTPKKGFIYSIMRGWANKHNNLQDFTHLHSLTWFIGLILMLGVAAMAWWADYEVLYGIEYGNTHNHNTSNALSITLATVIQVLILFCGGMAAKLIINKKYDSDNSIQLVIQSILFIGGLSASLYLSYQTYSAAAVKGLQAFDNTNNTYKTLKEEVLEEATNATNAAQKQYREDSIRLVAKYGELIAANSKGLESKIIEKRIKAENGEISWGTFEAKKARYERGIANQTKPHIEEKATALLALHQNHTSSLKTIIDKREEALDKLEEGLDGSLERVEEATSLAALATRGRNIGLNIISFILCVGLLFFAKGANKITPPIAEGVVGVGMMSGASEVLGENTNNTPEKEKNAVVTPTTPPNTPQKGGTIEANNVDVWDVLEDGSCVVLHIGKNDNKWRDKGWVKSQISNRQKKEDNATTKQGIENNKKWRELWERKLALMKRVEEGGDV